MTIDQAYRLTQYLANKAEKNHPSPVEWNLIASLTQLEVANDYARDAAQYRSGLPDTPASYARQARLTDYLRPLFTTLPMSFTNGISSDMLPADYLRKTSVTTADGNNVDELEDAAFALRSKSKLLPPTTGFPICRMAGTRLDVRPTTLTTLTLNYWRKPVVPVWNYSVGAILAINVVNGGSGYTAATVGVTGGNGSGATATATVDSGAVTSIAVTVPGTGYTTLPTITITGDGTGATAVAVLSTVPVYDSSTSVDFELAEESHNEICYRILQKIGVNLSFGELFQEAALLNQQAK